MSLEFKRKIIRDFSRAAKNYDNYAILQRKVTERLFAIGKNALHSKTGNILDIGCGTGYYHELLRKNKISLPLVQVDISLSMCRVATNYASLPEYGVTHTCTADMHQLPLADNSIATVFSSMTMQWAENLGKSFAEVKRVLEDKGNFAISIVGDGSLHELRSAFLAAGYAAPIHTFTSIEHVEKMLLQSGLQLSRICCETVTMNYEDIYHLLRAIRNVGAGYKGSKISGQTGRKYFARVEEMYRSRLPSSVGLPLSWNIIYITGGKL